MLRGQPVPKDFFEKERPDCAGGRPHANLWESSLRPEQNESVALADGLWSARGG